MKERIVDRVAELTDNRRSTIELKVYEDVDNSSGINDRRSTIELKGNFRSFPSNTFADPKIYYRIERTAPEPTVLIGRLMKIYYRIERQS